MHPSEYPIIARFSSVCVFHQITAVGNGHELSADSDDATDSSKPADDTLVKLSTGVDDELEGTSADSFSTVDEEDEEIFGF